MLPPPPLYPPPQVRFMYTNIDLHCSLPSSFLRPPQVPPSPPSISPPSSPCDESVVTIAAGTVTPRTSHPRRNTRTPGGTRVITPRRRGSHLQFIQQQQQQQQQQHLSTPTRAAHGVRQEGGKDGDGGNDNEGVSRDLSATRSSRKRYGSSAKKRWERHSAQGGGGGEARTTPRTPQTPQTPRTPRVPVHDVQQLYRRSDIIEHNISIGIELAAVLEAAGAYMNEWLKV